MLGTSCTSSHVASITTRCSHCSCLYQFLNDTIDAQDRNQEWVYIRRFERNSEELSLLMRFSSLNMRAEHWNRVVPIVDSFDDPDDPAVVYVVSPLMHTASHPVWVYVDEGMEFFEQMFGVSVAFKFLTADTLLVPMTDAIHRIC